MPSIISDLYVVNLSTKHYALIQVYNSKFVDGTVAVFYISPVETRYVGEAHVRDMWKSINSAVPNHIEEIFSTATILEVLNIYDKLPLV